MLAFGGMRRLGLMRSRDVDVGEVFACSQDLVPKIEHAGNVVSHVGVIYILLSVEILKVVVDIDPLVVRNM